MAKTKKKSPKAAEIDWPACQLMLVVEPGAGARERLTAAFEHCQAVAVLIRPKPEHQLGAGEVKPLVDLAQDQGAAAIVFGDAQLAKTLRADGVHLPAGLDTRARIADARAMLGAEASIGVDAGHSRHEAMEAGEAGAEYVAFGYGAGGPAGRLQRDELIAWWAGIFEVPCVVLDVECADEVRIADKQGADFAALTLPSQASPDEIAVLTGEADAALLQGVSAGE